MSIVVWRVSRFSDEPERREYERETAHFYVRKNGSRDAKRTDYYAIYADYDDAAASIKRRVDAEVEAKRDSLVRKVAPELLEALSSLLAVVEQYDLPLSDPERIAARMAIAKARGEA